MGDKKQIDKEKRIDPLTLQVPENIPVLPLHGFVFFPGMGFPLQVSSESSKQLIDDALLADRMIGLVTTREEKKPEEKETLSQEDLFNVGVVGYIHKMTKVEDGFYQVLVSGTKKIEITGYTDQTPYLKAHVKEIPMVIKEDKTIEALVFNVRNQFQKLVKLSQLPQEMVVTINALADPFHISYLVASQLNLKIDDEQALLELQPLEDVLHKTAKELTKRLETVEMSHELQESMKKDMDERQREYFLRQQLASIRKELGEDDDHAGVKELRERVEETELSENAREAVDKEMKRLERIPPSSPEYTVSRNYVDWILDLPWNVSSEDALDLNKAEDDLNKDHYGLQKVKKRILEFLAVRKLKQDIHGPILCLSGPPGVGKTSLGQSIAHTMGRKFIRIALGGVHDEAEIRGHRRTYIGALPGRILQSLKKAGTNNPVFLLDEIDKLGSDFRGDPSSALLEVLDPEQNSTFTDHYLDIEFDLSKIMFITTANVLDTIPGPLRDRMEIVDLPGYTEHEKVAIAQNHLISKQLEAHALKSDDLEISEEAVRTIIQSYTREAGVRNLEREIAGICRGVASKIARGEHEKTVVTAENIYEFLGPIRYFSAMKARTWGPGLATGLAWTPVGGEILFIETSRMKGRGGLTLTGKLGEVMKESATAALTYIRSHAEELGIDEDVFSNIDLHVHVPEGAIPKDGPSAGVSMVSSLVSVITGKTVRQDIAMTGEITLRGDVLPVGGIGEKVLAALRAGINEIILPILNEKDVMEIQEDVREGVTFHYVPTIQEVLTIALAEEAKK